MKSELVNRRSFVRAAGGVGAISLMPLALGRAAGTRVPLDYDDPSDLFAALIKLRGDLDGKLVFWWLQGIRYGVVGAVATPLFQTHAASIQRFEAQEDGSYVATFFEASYYTDLKTGELLKEWRNPFTGKLNKVESILLGPVKNRLSVDGMSAPEDPPGVTMEMSTETGPAVVAGDDIWIKSDTKAKIVTKDGSRPTYHGADLSTYLGRKSELEDSSIRSASSTVHYQSATNWRSWMGLGDVPGHLMARAVGRKVQSPAEFPAEYLALVDSEHPGLFDDPEATMASAAPPSSFLR